MPSRFKLKRHRYAHYGVPFRDFVKDSRYHDIRDSTESLCIGKGIEGVEIALKSVAVGVGDATNYLLDQGEGVKAENLKRTLEILSEAIIQFEV
jgi:hypothetical protein